MKVKEEKIRKGYTRITVEIENEKFISACKRVSVEICGKLLKEDGTPMTMKEAAGMYGMAMFHSKASSMLIQETLPLILEEKGMKDNYGVATDVIQIGDQADLIYTAVVNLERSKETDA